jgi:hypothetical protein
VAARYAFRYRKHEFVAAGSADLPAAAATEKIEE